MYIKAFPVNAKFSPYFENYLEQRKNKMNFIRKPESIEES
jgi:hypothetical protein